MLVWHPFILIYDQATKEEIMMNTCYHHVSRVITQVTQHGDLNNVRWCVRVQSLLPSPVTRLQSKNRNDQINTWESTTVFVRWSSSIICGQASNQKTLKQSYIIRSIWNVSLTNQNPQVFLILWYISIRPPLTLSCAERVWASREGNATLSRCSNLIKSRDFFPQKIDSYAYSYFLLNIYLLHHRMRKHLLFMEQPTQIVDREKTVCDKDNE